MKKPASGVEMSRPVLRINPKPKEKENGGVDSEISREGKNREEDRQE